RVSHSRRLVPRRASRLPWRRSILPKAFRRDESERSERASGLYLPVARLSCTTWRLRKDLSPSRFPCGTCNREQPAHRDSLLQQISSAIRFPGLYLLRHQFPANRPTQDQIELSRRRPLPCGEELPNHPIERSWLLLTPRQ